MKTAICESIGVACFCLATALPFGCVPVPVKANLQPLVATAGRYALMEPAVKPKPAVCETCGGKGVVGDGRVSVPCPACRPDAKATPACSCPCNGAGYIVKSGTRVPCECRPTCACKCKDGKCNIAR